MSAQRPSGPTDAMGGTHFARMARLGLAFLDLAAVVVLGVMLWLGGPLAG